VAPSPARFALLAALVVATPVLAGCNLKDWYNQLGDVKIFLAPVGPSNSSIADFRTLQIAIYGVSVKQVLIVDPKDFTYASPPVTDLVAAGARGERTQIAQVKETIRPIESVTVTLDVVQALDAQGKSVPVCREGQAITGNPCFFLDAQGFIRFSDRNIPISRGNVEDFTMPLQVLSRTQGGQTEYFLNMDQSQATVVVE
jgi:hypothetical protein